jgi:hypothetical protein
LTRPTAGEVIAQGLIFSQHQTLPRTLEVECRLFADGHGGQTYPLTPTWGFIFVDLYFKAIGP